MSARNNVIESKEYKAAQAVAAHIHQDVEEKKMHEKNEKMLALTSLEEMRLVAKMGMRYVDPADIQPAKILLVQKLSDIEVLHTADGAVPTSGQFFHTGYQTILDTFDCFVLFAKKDTYIDKRKPENGEKPVYQMIGALQQDLSLFGMTLRASQSYALNTLFTASVTQGYPMFAFHMHVESKELENKDGKWLIPVFRVGAIETNIELLNILFDLARRFDHDDGHQTLHTSPPSQHASSSAVLESDVKPEDVEDVSDIPF